MELELIKEVLKKFKLNSKEIDTLLDETKKDEYDDILSGWDSRYSQVIGEKLKPIIENELKESNTQEIFNKQKEAIRKARKSINDTLGLGLSSKQLDEPEDDFKNTLKEHSSKETDTKLTDLQAQYAEEKRLRELAEGKLTDEVEKVKKEFETKDIQREIQVKKLNLIASKDSAKFDKSDMELIDYAIEGAILKQGVSFVTENGKLFAVKDGAKLRNGSNEFIEYESFIDGIITPKFEIKTRSTPDVKKDEHGNIIPERADSEAKKRLMADYAAKGKPVDTTA